MASTGIELNPLGPMAHNLPGPHEVKGLGLLLFLVLQLAVSVQSTLLKVTVLGLDVTSI